MDPTNLNIQIALVTFILTLIVFNKTDKQYYRCSTSTHIFGLIFPLVVILYLNKSIDKQNTTYIIILGMAYSMFFFHTFHEVYKR